MLQNGIQPKSTKSPLQRLIGIQLHAQQYPWCLSREGWRYCFYKTQEQCQWTASGIGGCALNPRLLLPNEPRDSDQNLLSHMK